MKQVLIWSKYSPNCKRLIDLMDSYGANIQRLCIDNSTIRERITKDSRLKITVVPTLLSIYPSGVIEKYEGEKVTELLLSSFPPRNLEPPIRRPDIPKKVQKTKTKTTPKNKPKQTNSMESSLSDLEDEEDLFPSPDENVSSKPQPARQDPKENLPIKPKSNLATRAAAIAQSRESLDASMPRPTNNIVPNKDAQSD